jgi:hypothetical protein
MWLLKEGIYKVICMQEENLKTVRPPERATNQFLPAIPYLQPIHIITKGGN